MIRSLYTTAVLSLVAIGILLGGCGGGETVTPPVTLPAPFSPTVHSGYAVYLQGGEYGDSIYIPQNASDHFSVIPGVYKIVALRESEIGTMGIAHTTGGIDWPAVVTKHGSGTVVSPTLDGWVLGPGSYDAEVRNPAGGTINISIAVGTADLDGYHVRMVAVDAAGIAFPKDTDGHYQIPIWTEFAWSQIWKKNGYVVTAPSRFDAYASIISGSENITWVDGGRQMGKVISTAAYAVRTYDNDTPGGSGGFTVDTVFVDFIPETTGPGKG